MKDHQIKGIHKDATIVEAGHVLLQSEVSSLIVYDEDRVVGIFTKNDFIRRSLEQPFDFRSMTVSEGMTTELFSTTGDSHLEEVFAEMVRRKIRHAPVMDDGKVIGMITSIDILLHQRDVMFFETLCLGDLLKINSQPARVLC